MRLTTREYDMDSLCPDISKLMLQKCQQTLSQCISSPVYPDVYTLTVEVYSVVLLIAAKRTVHASSIPICFHQTLKLPVD